MRTECLENFQDFANDHIGCINSFRSVRQPAKWLHFPSKASGLPSQPVLPGALFSGLQAASMRAATYGTVRIGLCEPLQEVAGRSGGAVIAGVLATVVGNPFEAASWKDGGREAGSGSRSGSAKEKVS